MTLEQRNLMVLDGVDPDVREKGEMLLVAARAASIILMVTQGYRTFAHQAELYAMGRTAAGPIVTNAKPGFSPHNWKRAFDVAIKDFPGDTTPDNVYDGDWAQVGHMGEMVGLVWGGRWGRFPDLPHFELMGARTYVGLLAQFPRGLG